MNASHNHAMGSTVAKYDPDAAAQGPAAKSRMMATMAAPAGTLGLDVSGWQVLQAGDWTNIWNNGARFAYVKATESTDYTSSQFSEQYTDSYNAGLVRGAYHFATPNTSSGSTQANFFVNHGGGWSSDGRTLPPLLDIEYNPYGATCYGLSQSAMVAWIADFSSTVRARTGRLPAIYSTTDWWTRCTGNDASFGANPLFIARYTSNVAGGPGSLPASWSQYTFWQFADSGIFPGDQDIFNGNENDLRAFATNSGLQPSGAAPAPASRVALAEATDGTRYSFWKGSDGYLWENVWNGSSWSGPITTGGYVGPGSGLSAAVDGSGRLSITWRGGDGAIWIAASNDGAWQPVQQVRAAPAGSVFASPAVTVTGSGVKYVFWKGSDGFLYQAFRGASPNDAWSNAVKLTAYVGPGTALAASVDGVGSTFVYWRGGDDGLWEANWAGSAWTAAHQLPTAPTGALRSEPGSAITSWGARFVFWKGADGFLCQSIWTGQAWAGPYNLGVYLGPTTAVAAAVDGAGSTAVTWLGGDSGVWESHWIGKWSQATRIVVGN
jgi:GH25 family lysozyme M1 (1,4-beta-N-acetylmuramidase)